MVGRERGELFDVLKLDKGMLFRMFCPENKIGSKDISNLSLALLMEIVGIKYARTSNMAEIISGLEFYTVFVTPILSVIRFKNWRQAQLIIRQVFPNQICSAVSGLIGNRVFNTLKRVHVLLAAKFIRAELIDIPQNLRKNCIDFLMNSSFDMVTFNLKPFHNISAFMRCIRPLHFHTFGLLSNDYAYMKRFSAVSKTSLLGDKSLHSEATATKQIFGLDEHVGEILCVCFSCDGHIVATGSCDGAILIYKISNGFLRFAHSLRGSKNPVECLMWSKTAFNLISYDTDNPTIYLWDLSCLHKHDFIDSSKSLPPSRIFLGHEMKVLAMLWDSTKPGAFLSSGIDRKILLWSCGSTLKDKKCNRYHEVLKDVLVYDMAMTTDGQYVFLLMHTNTIAFLSYESIMSPENSSVKSCTPLVLFEVDSSCYISSISLAADNNEILLNLSKTVQLHKDSTSHTVHMCNARNFKQIHSFSFCSTYVSSYVLKSIFCGAMDAYVASGNEHGIIHVWRRCNGKLVTKFHAHFGPINCIVKSPSNSALIISIGDDKMVRMWKLP